MTLTAGESTCPICERTWTVTPFDDCMVPGCGCYGTDTSAANPARPCQPCGIKHAWTCPQIEGNERRADSGPPKLVEIMPDGSEIHRGLV